MSKASLEKLLRAARKAPRSAEVYETLNVEEAPLGFSTRVAALWSRQRGETIIFVERWAWRGLACALAICALTAVAQPSVESAPIEVEVESEELPVDDMELF